MFSFWIAESFIFQSLSFRLSKQAVSMSHSTEEWSEPPDTWLPFLIALRTLRAWVLRDLSWSLVLPSGWFYMACKQKRKKTVWKHTKNAEKQPFGFHYRLSYAVQATVSQRIGRTWATKERVGICLKLQERDEALSHLWKRILPPRGCYWHGVSCGKS